MDCGQRILLVEDSRDDVALVTTALGAFHSADRNDVVGDGAAALEYLECRRSYQQRTGGAPAFVLLDLKLPKISGLEVLQRLRANPGLRTVPVVVLTSSREEPDLLRAYDLGTNAYVVKPVRFDDFARAVREIGTSGRRSTSRQRHAGAEPMALLHAETLTIGASDFVLKDRLDRLPAVIQRWAPQSTGSRQRR